MNVKLITPINKTFKKNYNIPTINAPSTQITGETISNQQTDSLDLSWTNGNKRDYAMSLTYGHNATF